ncbi:MAG: hypothetical protein ACYC2W_07630 [Desulfurivibrionaceae bacterium]
MTTYWIKTSFPGVRYRKDKSRKHGVKFGQYYTIRYQKDGERQEEGLGWASDGWAADRAKATLQGV